MLWEGRQGGSPSAPSTPSQGHRSFRIRSDTCTLLPSRFSITCDLYPGPTHSISVSLQYDTLVAQYLSVRMAEWSKAPDSSSASRSWGFWSPHGGVGSNPTSDTSSFPAPSELGDISPPRKEVLVCCLCVSVVQLTSMKSSLLFHTW